MTITLRQESATGATTKGSALTFSELDNNFVHLLRQGSVSVGADSGTQQTLGEADKDSTILFSGGTNISTTVGAPDSAGATTVTINSSAIALTDLSVGAEGASAGNGSISYNNSTGEFTYTPPLLDGLTISGAVAFGDNQLQAPELRDYKETIHALGSTDSPSISISNGNVQTVTITSGLSLPAFSDAAAGQSVTLIVSGSGTASGTGAYKFAGGNKTLTTESVVSIFFDGTTYYASINTDFQA